LFRSEGAPDAGKGPGEKHGAFACQFCQPGGVPAEGVFVQLFREQAFAKFTADSLSLFSEFAHPDALVGHGLAEPLALFWTQHLPERGAQPLRICIGPLSPRRVAWRPGAAHVSFRGWLRGRKDGRAEKGGN
jgi:hypothetical protein